MLSLFLLENTHKHRQTGIWRPGGITVSSLQCPPRSLTSRTRREWKHTAARERKYFIQIYKFKTEAGLSTEGQFFSICHRWSHACLTPRFICLVVTDSRIFPQHSREESYRDFRDGAKKARVNKRQHTVTRNSHFIHANTSRKMLLTARTPWISYELRDVYGFQRSLF